MMNRFAEKLAAHSLSLRRARPEILQVNVGKLCNLTCMHCHVNAGPRRKEFMTRKTVDRIINWLARTQIPTLDLTGGAPEMIPDFRYFIERVKVLAPSRHMIDRCNLTILLQHGYGDLPEFLAMNKVEIIASMPCYSAKNVDAQRGEGVFDDSIAALQLLIHAFNPATISGLMCCNTISVGWRGEVYDCDFNQQLGMQWSDNGTRERLFLWDIDPDKIENREISTGNHCFGCTAGAGSSCGGSIL